MTLITTTLSIIMLSIMMLRVMRLNIECNELIVMLMTQHDVTQYYDPQRNDIMFLP